MRVNDDRQLVVKIARVSDVTEAQARAVDLMGVVERIDHEHLVRQRDAVALADGTLALVFDQVSGGSLADVLGARGSLTPGETITTVAPLFGALADLHAAGIVHGGLAPENVLYTDDGRPQMGDLGAVGLAGHRVRGSSEPWGFLAPELAGGADPSPASDVYALAAIGWSCLTGAPPAPAAESATLAVGPASPPRLVQILASCLRSDPMARPSAALAATEVFDASRAEPVQLVSVSDPAGEITRRIREAAVSALTAAPPATEKRRSRTLIIGVVALVVAVALAGGATWFLRLRPVAVKQGAVGSTALPSPISTPTMPPRSRPATPPERITDVVMAPDSPRTAAAGLLQALVDARALAYASRDPGLLDLVYAPGAEKAEVDRSNIATALQNRATYLGLTFEVKDVVYLDGVSETARIRATIITPDYRTGQPDGRKVAHQRESVGPSVFTVKLVPDGWRILSVTAP